MGAAWNERECNAYGIELGDVRTRLDRFEEGVEIVARLLTDETTTFAGDHYALTDARCSPKPIQRPRPPITIGGTGERRTARVVARWADHWDLGFTPPTDVRRKLDALAQHCEVIGRNPSAITISAVVRTAEGTCRRESATSRGTSSSTHTPAAISRSSKPSRPTPTTRHQKSSA